MERSGLLGMHPQIRHAQRVLVRHGPLPALPAYCGLLQQMRTAPTERSGLLDLHPQIRHAQRALLRHGPLPALPALQHPGNKNPLWRFLTNIFLLHF